MIRGLASLTTVALLGGCGGAGDPDPQIAFFPSEVALPAVGWKDTNPPWSTVGVLNQTWFPFQVSGAALTGDGAPFLELQAPGGDAGVSLDVRSSIAIRVRVAAPDAAALRNWRTTSPNAPLEADLTFNTVGTGATDPTTGAVDATKSVTTPYTVSLRFKLSCDLDADGVDATACGGGTDCNDTLAAVRPGVAEVCDGIDNDCNGTVDDACTPP